MTDYENILVQISEFVFAEMGGVKSVDLNGNILVIVMDNGKKFIVEIKPKN